MKNIIKFIFAFTIISFLFISCKDNGTNNSNLSVNGNWEGSITRFDSSSYSFTIIDLSLYLQQNQENVLGYGPFSKTDSSENITMHDSYTVDASGSFANSVLNLKLTGLSGMSYVGLVSSNYNLIIGELIILSNGINDTIPLNLKRK